MYDAFFGLSKRPFASIPQVDQYFPAVAIEAARLVAGPVPHAAKGSDWS